MTNQENSWVDYLATPPNMFEAHFANIPNGMLSNLQPPSKMPVFEPVLPEIPAPVPITPPPPSVSYQTVPEGSDIENRSILISNLNPNVTEEDLQTLLSQFRSINKIDIARIAEGVAFVDFYDLRNATTAKMILNGTSFKGNTINISFAPLPHIEDPKKPPNNGTIVIFHLPQGMTNEQIIASFGQYGEIKQIRGTPSKATQKFIEYWDTRSAENALVSMNGKFVMGARISIEFSLPGGFRRGIQRLDQPTPIIQKPHH